MGPTPSILRALGKWAWKALTVCLPAFIKALGRTVWNVVKGLGEIIGRAISSIASAIHSLFMAIATFLRNVTLQDVLRAFKEALNAILCNCLCSLFDIFWWTGKALVRIILFVPETIGRIVLEMGSLAGKVGREIFDLRQEFINPPKAYGLQVIVVDGRKFLQDT
ncbi:hypothetical protein BT96DRAFT_1000253 [Gymnopus androsaceus JB14]|uniref:Uncharacterized protein n=1 Tax=Gymnopus androsaceus JB14 TaxID=1447944 RepID=A0A6A4H4A8_9AGAR|nr:hypothetical protein BT96DRAFT_1000253 [Gymnopus androsaceus JB14]